MSLSLLSNNFWILLPGYPTATKKFQGKHYVNYKEGHSFCTVAKITVDHWFFEKKTYFVLILPNFYHDLVFMHISVVSYLEVLGTKKANYPSMQSYDELTLI